MVDGGRRTRGRTRAAAAAAAAAVAFRRRAHWLQRLPIALDMAGGSAPGAPVSTDATAACWRARDPNQHSAGRVVSAHTNTRSRYLKF